MSATARNGASIWCWTNSRRPKPSAQPADAALSGGWQRLALIARAWIAEPDVLLLDEPTNHLDLEKLFSSKRWIAAAGRYRPIVIASHDRDFLDACTTQDAVSAAGGIHCLRASLPARPRSSGGARCAQANRFDKERREVKRLRQNAGELRNIGINSGSDLLLRKAKQLGGRAEAIEQNLRAAHKERSGEIRLGNRGTHARVLVALENVRAQARRRKAVRHPQARSGAGRPHRGPGPQWCRQVAAGPAAASGDASEPTNARHGVRTSPSVVLGYTDQEMSQLPANASAHDFILSTFRLGDQRSRALLAGRALAVEKQRLPHRAGCRRAKRRGSVCLALRLTEPNFYLMDEPTNHVDIPGREQLEAEILASEATCLVVSHDRSFVDAIGTRFLLIEKAENAGDRGAGGILRGDAWVMDELV